MNEYIFTCKTRGIAKGYVTAESKEEAKKKILNSDYDDITDEYADETTDVNLEDIEEI